MINSLAMWASQVTSDPDWQSVASHSIGGMWACLQDMFCIIFYRRNVSLLTRCFASHSTSGICAFLQDLFPQLIKKQPALCWFVKTWSRLDRPRYLYNSNNPAGLWTCVPFPEKYIALYETYNQCVLDLRALFSVKALSDYLFRVLAF
jgi:hypothetical protein